MRKKWRLLYSFSYLPQNGFLLWPHAPPRPKSSCRATSLRTENPQASRVVAWCLRGIHPAVALDSPPSQPDLTSQSRVSESHGLKSSPVAKEAGGVNQVYQRRRQGQQMQRRTIIYRSLAKASQSATSKNGKSSSSYSCGRWRRTVLGDEDGGEQHDDGDAEDWVEGLDAGHRLLDAGLVHQPSSLWLLRTEHATSQ